MFISYTCLRCYIAYRHNSFRFVFADYNGKLNSYIDALDRLEAQNVGALRWLTSYSKNIVTVKKKNEYSASHLFTEMPHSKMHTNLETPNKNLSYRFKKFQSIKQTNFYTSKTPHKSWISIGVVCYICPTEKLSKL